MKKEVLVRGPALSQSGYGEHTRFVLRALRAREDEFNIYVLPTPCDRDWETSSNSQDL